MSVFLSVQHRPRFTFLGSLLDSRLITSYCIDELCVLTLIGFLILSCRSKIFSSVTTFLGIVLDFKSMILL
jgi:hypothetical protein